MKCELEVGGSNADGWWWNIQLSGAQIDMEPPYTKTRSGCVRHGKRLAQKLGLTVTRVFTYGEPE